jgi:hypothetical protein
MLKKRSRTVSFRLSDDEYKSLKSVSATCGARSVSEFTRSVACHMNAGHDGDEVDKLQESLRALNERMEMLDHSIQMLAEELKEKHDVNPKTGQSNL